MKTTMMVMVGLLAALSIADAGTAVDSAAVDETCEPVKIDDEGTPIVNPDCIVAAPAEPETPHS